MHASYHVTSIFPFCVPLSVCSISFILKVLVVLHLKPHSVMQVHLDAKVKVDLFNVTYITEITI